MEFRLPELGEGVYEAELVSWHVKPGDVVERGQNLVEVLTDKATMEVPAPFAGTISTLHAEVGAMLKIGDVVLDYQPAGGAQPEAKPQAQSSAPAASTAKAAARRPAPEPASIAIHPVGNGTHRNGNPQTPSVAPASVQA